MRLTEIQQDMFDKPKSPYLGEFHVMINGKIWKKDGKPVSFATFDSATKSADSIMVRYQKATQVVPAKLANHRVA